ncbi:thioredoxin fold domain-containing protein [uncultured Thiohalocapsa sp.]|uniref:thioredoxin family protein n=1 Tax=uncultured Thiohalocapsa sp. TaxID=768990 RepID=UPI0025CEBFF0|nr:thioredoxin fold domain-containing protein [uncultured Thiohalocapsa sp.]
MTRLTAYLLLLAAPLALQPVLAASDAEVLSDLQNPGYHSKPDWFKNSFLDIREDVAEAADAGKRVMLYFYQDGCPYCEKLLRENFADQEISQTAQDGFDVIAINIWGDREVTGTDGSATTEKAFAAALGVQYTPTILLLDEDASTVLRIDGYYPPHQFNAGLQYVALKRERDGESFRDFYQRQDATAASGKLHQEPGFLEPPFRLADNRAQSPRPLVVMFEQPVCAACDELHQDILRRDPVALALTNLDAAVVDTYSTDSIQTPDGRELAIRDWAAELGINYTPSLVFFDTGGNEVFRTDGYLKAFHIHGLFDYVATGAYEHQPNFQRWLQHRTDALHARGIDYDLMR